MNEPQRHAAPDIQHIIADHDYLKAKLAAAIQDLDSTRRELVSHREKAHGNYWGWQGDEHDHLESLVCPVLIDPSTLKTIFEAKNAADHHAKELSLALFEQGKELDAAESALDGRLGVGTPNCVRVACQEYVAAEDELPEWCDGEDYRLSTAVRSVVSKLAEHEQRVKELEKHLSLSDNRREELRSMLHQSQERVKELEADLAESKSWQLRHLKDAGSYYKRAAVAEERERVLREALESAVAGVWDGHYSGKGVTVEYARAVQSRANKALAATGKESVEIEERVIQSIRARRDAGRLKYGTTMERTDLSTHDWLQHAQEEALDLAIYLEKLKQAATGKEGAR